MSINKGIVLAAALVAALAVEASAQQGNPQALDNRAPVGPGELVGMLDAYAVLQSQAALKLSEAQYAPFVTRLKKLQDTRRRNQQARNRIVQALRQLAGPQARPPFDEAAIRERLKQLREHDQLAAAELNRAYEVVDEVLDAAQQARFRIFEETLERRKLDLLMRARQAARRGGTR